MFDQGSQMVQLVKQFDGGPSQAQNLQLNTAGDTSLSPDPVDSARFGEIVKTSQSEVSPLGFKNSIMLGRENLSGRTVLFPSTGVDQSIGSSGLMSSAVKEAWKKLRGNMNEFEGSLSRLGDEGMTLNDSLVLSKKMVHLEAGFHLTFTSLQKATQSFDTILRAQ